LQDKCEDLQNVDFGVSGPITVSKVWPHGDYALHEVGRLTLDRNVTDYHAEMEQARWSRQHSNPTTSCPAPV
jgi:catalase